ERVTQLPTREVLALGAVFGAAHRLGPPIGRGSSRVDFCPIRPRPTPGRLRRHGCGPSLGVYLKPTEKSWPHRLTAVDSRATQFSSSVTCMPSQPYSQSKPPGVFM